MRRVRIIPVLLIHKNGLVKSARFKKYTYVGDPINAVKIFNEKEVDELVILDIDATAEGRGPDFERLKEIAGEAFIPLAYGGGITTVEQVKDLFYLGVEKCVFNYAAIHNPALITAVAGLVGSQSVVVSIDVKKNVFGKYKVYTKNGNEKTGLDPVEFAKKMEGIGAGEIFFNSIDRDGMYAGFDLELIKEIGHAISIPLIACGGASGTDDFRNAINAGASAAAAGSLFVFQRPHNAVLISYPSQKELKEKIFEQVI